MPRPRGRCDAWRGSQGEDCLQNLKHWPPDIRIIIIIIIILLQLLLLLLIIIIIILLALLLVVAVIVLHTYY